MTHEDVKQIIKKDMDDVNASPFPEKLPPWLLDSFDKMVMETPQKDIPFFSPTVRSILGKKRNLPSLTLYEGQFVLNMFLVVPLKLIHKDILTALDRKEVLGQIMYRLNAQLEKTMERLSRKEESLLKGVRSTPRIVAPN